MSSSNNRVFGLDVTVLTMQPTDYSTGVAVQGEVLDVLGTFESIDMSYDPIIKESTAARDTLARRRVIGQDTTFSINTLIQGNPGFLYSYFASPTRLHDLVITVGQPGEGMNPNLGNSMQIILNGFICSKCSLNLGGEAGKETLEFKPGPSSTWTTLSTPSPN